ncbi:MAG: hypothetical protein ACLFWD_10505 [Anaerolineales bacterium]
MVLEVPAELPQQEYPALINGQSFSCTPSADFADRLFCVGPRLIEGAQGEMEVYGEGCSEPVFVTSFSIPYPLYPTPTPTETPKPTATCDPQTQQCQ